MSFRDLRNFTETLRALGFPRPISLQSFRSPNFPLVAEILIWLVKRYEPTVDIPTDISTEPDRVLFVKAVAEFMASKAHVELNTKNVHKADGYAVKEMLKVTSLLYSTMKTTETALGDCIKEDSVKSMFSIAPQSSDLDAAHQLASTVTLKGASLCDLLGQEVDLKESLSVAIAKPFEITEIQKALKAAIAEDLEQLDKTKDMLTKLVSDEASLDSKIKKKKQELEQNQTRLKTVQSVIPATMDEYQKIEEELKEQYEIYVKKCRNLCHLESQLEAFHHLEQERFEEAQNKMRMMQQKMKQVERDLMWSTNQGSLLDVPEDRDSDGDSDEPAGDASGNFVPHGKKKPEGQNEDGETDGDEDDDEDDELSKELEDDSLGSPIPRIHGFYLETGQEAFCDEGQ